jgi:hypothetical protein
VAHQEVPNEEAAVEMIGALKDRLEDQRPVVGCRKSRKRRTKGDVVRGTTKGWMFEKRREAQKKCHNDIRDRCLKQQLCMTGKQGKCQRGAETDHSAGGHQASSRVFCQDSENEC